LAAVGLLALVAFIGIMVLTSSFGGPAEEAKVAGRAKEKTVFEIGAPQRIPGTNLVRMDVNVSGGASNPYGSSGGGPDQRNIVLLDEATGASRRLLPENGRRIDQAHFLPAMRTEPAGSGDYALAKGEDEGAPPAYYALVLVRPGDSRMKDVLVGRLGDGRQRLVMEGIDGVDGIWMQSPTRLAMIVREGLRLYLRVVDVPTLKVVASHPIAVD
jgi:hypothetical protein